MTSKNFDHFHTHFAVLNSYPFPPAIYCSLVQESIVIPCRTSAVQWRKPNTRNNRSKWFTDYRWDADSFSPSRKINDGFFFFFYRLFATSEKTHNFMGHRKCLSALGTSNIVCLQTQHFSSLKLHLAVQKAMWHHKQLLLCNCILYSCCYDRPSLFWEALLELGQMMAVYLYLTFCLKSF